jgi:hypothetical protein
MNHETEQISAQYINSNFVRKIEEGRVKEAEAAGTTFLRKKMREDSFARRVLTPVTLTEDELDRALDSDQPQKIVEKEPDSVATYVPFKGSGELTWFYGPRYAVRFGKTESQKFTKSKFELMTYRNDIRKILSDNSVKDMAKEEDKKFIETVEACIALDPGTQSFTPAGGLTPDNFKSLLQALVAKKKPIGKVLCSKSLYYEVLKLNQSQVGNDKVARHNDDGLEGEETLWGDPVITTIKAGTVLGGDNVIKDNVMYLFAPENYLGNFFLLQDATLFIKQEADLIQFWSYAAPGIGLGMSDAMIKMTF